MVTIKKIAELSGVSRGTVDRVLNNRGKVKAEKAELIREIAKQLNYRPNKAALGLAAKKVGYKFSVILTSKGNPFFKDVIEGITSAHEGLGDYGVDLELIELKGYQPEKQIRAIQQAAENSHLIMLNPIDNPEVAACLREVQEKGVKVLHLNTDIPDNPKLCYVGSDYMASGRTAAGLMGLILNAEQANILIVSGSQNIRGHRQRFEGFQEVIQQKYPDLRISEVLESMDDDKLAYEMSKRALSEGDYDAIYILAAGTKGVCRAVEELGLSGKICIVCSDLTDSSQSAMQSGIIQAAICQGPYSQGYDAIRLAFAHLAFGDQCENEYIKPNDIKIAENS